MKTIAIASDHAGYELKQLIAAHLKSRGYTVNDFGTAGTEPVDYPDFINNANMISLGARLVDWTVAIKIVEVWLMAEFEGGRHLRRIGKIE